MTFETTANQLSNFHSESISESISSSMMWMIWHSNHNWSFIFIDFAPTISAVVNCRWSLFFVSKVGSWRLGSIFKLNHPVQIEIGSVNEDVDFSLLTLESFPSQLEHFQRKNFPSQILIPVSGWPNGPSLLRTFEFCFGKTNLLLFVKKLTHSSRLQYFLH